METGTDMISRQNYFIWHGIQLKILSPVLRLTACTCIMPEIVAEIVITHPDSFLEVVPRESSHAFQTTNQKSSWVSIDAHTFYNRAR